MADIDRLQIQINADAANAADGINALASALYKSGRAAGTAFNELTDVAKALRSMKSGLKIPASYNALPEQVETLFGKLRDIQTPNVDHIVHTFEKVGDAFYNAATFKVDSSFTDGVNRIAAAANSLSSTDFSGFNNMSEALGNIPENMRVTFGATSGEIEELTSNLNEIKELIAVIGTDFQNAGNTTSRNTMLDATERNTNAMRVFNSVLSEADRFTMENADSWRAHRNEVERALDAYAVFGRQAPESLQRLATEYGILEEEQSRFSKVLGLAGNSLQAFANSVVGVARGSLALLGNSVKAVLTPLTALGSAFSHAVTKAGDFFKSIKRIAMYRAIRTMIKAITDGFAEGIKNLYFYSQEVGTQFAVSMDRAATAALYLKNSIGAATAPLTNALIPVLERVVDKVVDVINVFNEMTAALTNQPTWTKAIKYPVSCQNAAEDATKSAKKLKSTMLGFDELNVIEPNDNSAKNKMEDELDYLRMFKEAVTDFKLPEKFDALIVPIRLAWDAQGKQTLDALEKAWNNILGLVGSVKKSVAEVWGNGTGQKTLENALFIVQSIAYTVGNIAERFRVAWDEAGTGTQIIQNVWDTANNLLGLFGELWADAADWAARLNFTPLLNGIKSVTGAIKNLTSPSSGLYQIVKKTWEKVVLPVGKWLIEKGVPAVLRLTTSLINLAKKIVDVLEPELEWLFDNVLKPIGEWVGDFTINSISKVTDFIDNLTSFISGDYDFDIVSVLNDQLTDLSNPVAWLTGGTGIGMSLGQGLIDGLKDVLPKAGEAIKNFFTGKKSNGAHWDSDNPWDTGNVAYAGMSDISYLGGSLGNSQKDQEELGLFDSISQSWKNYIDDWGNGFDSIKETWSIGWETLKTDAVTVIDTVSGKWNGYKDDWGVGFEEMRKTASKKWASIKDTLKSGWDTLKTKVSDFSNAWSDYFGQIGQKAYDKWQDIKSTWTSGWAEIVNKVVGFKDDVFGKISQLKNDVVRKFSDLKDEAFKKWEELKSNLTLDSIVKGIEKVAETIKNTIKGIWDDGKGGGLKHWNISELIAGLFDNIGDFIKWGDIKNKFLENIEGILNFFVEGFNKLIDLMPDFIKESKGIASSFKIPKISLGRYESGGIPATGEVFIARESGAEMVGRIGNRTAVANNAQITDAVASAVYGAFTKAFRESGGSGEQNVNVYLDSKQITASVEQTQQSKGRPLFSGGVYI